MLSDDEAFRIGERLKTSGADIEARAQALAAEPAWLLKAKPKIKGSARAPAKGKRVARKRGKA